MLAQSGHLGVDTGYDISSWDGRSASGSVTSHQAGDPNNTVGTENCNRLRAGLSSACRVRR